MNEFERRLLNSIENWIDNPVPGRSAKESIQSLRKAALEVGQEAQFDEFVACIEMLSEAQS